MKFLIDLIFKRIAKSLSKYGAILGGIGFILLGIAGLIGHYWPDAGLPDVETEVAYGLIASGLTALGFGDKMDKAREINIEKLKRQDDSLSFQKWQ